MTKNVPEKDGGRLPGDEQKSEEQFHEALAERFVGNNF